MHKIGINTKITLLILSLTTMMANIAIVTALPQMKADFQNENIEFLTRLVVTIPSLVIAILAPFLTKTIHDIGKKNSTILALLLFSLSGSAGLYLENIYLVLLSRALLGVSIAILMIITTTLVGDYFKGEQRNKYMGLQRAFIAIGGVIFVAGGGILSDFSWRYTFAIYLLGLLIIPFVIKFILEINTSDNKTFKFKKSAILNSELFFINFLAFCFMVIFYVLPTQTPFLIINDFGASGTLAGLIISTAFLSNAIGAISFIKFKRHFSYSTIYLIGIVIIGFGFSLVGIVSKVEYFFFTAPVMGFAGGLLMTNVTAWMLNETKASKRLQHSGNLTSALFMGQFFSPLITYPIVQLFGVQKFFFIFGIFLIICVFISIFIKKIS